LGVLLTKRYFFYGLGTGVFSALIFIVAAATIFFVFHGGSSRVVQKPQETFKKPDFPLNLSDSSGGEADFNWKCQTLDGQDFVMYNLKGKTVFLNFWATWCPPCVAEMPGLDQLYLQIKDKPVVFLCLSPEDAKTVKDFMRNKNLSLPVYLLTGDPSPAFKTDDLPANSIISSLGKIVFKEEGPANWNDTDCVDFLKRVMKIDPNSFAFN
jgi:thiol-disulfide isomerase/thioredoxin